MPVYHYKARDKAGAVLNGTVESASREAVAAQLDDMGYFPVSIQEQRSGLFPRNFLDNLQTWMYPISLEDLIVFTRQLSTLISAGLPFISSFDTLIEQTENRRFKQIIDQVRREVEGGAHFSDALTKHPQVFSDLYVNMVRAGEQGGVLGEMLDRLAALTEHEVETRARIKAAIRYPQLVVLALGVAFVVLVVFVIPRFSAMYDKFSAELPLPTRLMILVNDLAHQYGYVMVGAAVLAIFGFKSYLRTPGGRYRWDQLKLKLPVFGPIFLKAALSRFARVFATLNRSGLPMLQTLEVSSRTVNNEVLSGVIGHVRESVRQGHGLHQPMRLSGFFPPIVVQMVAVGEETGRLDEMLLNVSKYYDRDVKYAIQNLSTSLEPLLLTLIGGAILFLALAIFLPWWNLANVMKGGG